MIRTECQKAFEVHMQEAYDNYSNKCAPGDEISFEYFASHLSIGELERIWHDACLWQLEQVKNAIRKL